MTVQRAAARIGAAGELYLHLEIDGKVAQIYIDFKRTIFAKGAVFLGPNWTNDVSWDLPADPADNLPAQTLPGFTDNPTVLELVRRFDALDYLAVRTAGEIDLLAS